MEGATVMAAEEEGLSEHVDIGGLFGKGGDFIGEEDRRRVEVLGDAVSDHCAELLGFLLSHFRV